MNTVKKISRVAADIGGGKRAVELPRKKRRLLVNFPVIKQTILCMKKNGQFGLKRSAAGALFFFFVALSVRSDVIVTNLGPYGMGIPRDETHGPLVDTRYEVDVDGNGVWDVAFERSTYDTFRAKSNVEVMTRIQGFPPVGRNVNSHAYPLSLGDVVGPTPLGGSTWHIATNAAGMRACADTGCAGTWPIHHTRPKYIPGIGHLPVPGYLAIELTRETGTHYGWVEVGVLDVFVFGTIYGWGWETEPGKPVTIIPEPGTLSLFSLAGIILLFVFKKYRGNASVH